MIDFITGIMHAFIFLSLFPKVFLFIILAELEVNIIFAFFILYSFTAVYITTYLATITLIILKIANIKYKSDKIKKINKILFKFFCVFVIIYISSIGMVCISRYWYLKKHGEKPEMEHVGNFNYGATSAAAGIPEWMLERRDGNRSKEHI